MQKITALAVGLTLVIAAVANAHQGVKDKDVLARMDGMKATQAAVKKLGAMASGAEPLHQARARMARDVIVREAGRIPDLFENAATDPMTEALPAIWDNWDDYVAKADALQEAALAIDMKDRAALRASLSTVGATCQACHKDYRKPRN